MKNRRRDVGYMRPPYKETCIKCGHKVNDIDKHMEIKHGKQN